MAVDIAIGSNRHRRLLPAIPPPEPKTRESVVGQDGEANGFQIVDATVPT